MSSALIPFLAALLLALTVFGSPSSPNPNTLNTSTTTHVTGDQTTIKSGSITTPVQTTTKSGITTATTKSGITTATTKSGITTTTVHTTNRPTITKSGNLTATATTAASVINRTSAGIATATLPIVSHFDIGSFVGGIVLALGVIAVFYFGRKFCTSRGGTRYRTIEETEAII